MANPFRTTPGPYGDRDTPEPLSPSVAPETFRDDFTQPLYLTGNGVVTSVRPEDPSFLERIEASNILRHIERPGGLVGKGPGAQFLDKQLLGYDFWEDINQEQGQDPTPLSVARNLYNVFPGWFDGGVDEALRAEDPDFDPGTAWDTFTEAYPDKSKILQDNGITKDRFSQVRNQRAFHYAINREMAILSSMQTLDRFARSRTGTERAAAGVASFALDWILTDPDTFHLAALGGVVAPVARASTGGRGLVSSTTLLIPAARGALASRWGLKAAIATESGVWGIASSVREQQQAIAAIEQLYGDQVRREFSTWEVVGSGALGFLIPYAAGTAFTRIRDGWQGARERRLAASGADTEDAIPTLGVTQESVALQRRQDDAYALAAQQLDEIAEASARRGHHTWSVSRKMLRELDIDPQDFADLIGRMHEAHQAGRLTVSAVDDVLATYMQQALRATRRLSEASEIAADLGPARTAAARQEAAAWLREWREHRRVTGDPVTNGLIRAEVRARVAEEYGDAAADLVTHRFTPVDYQPSRAAILIERVAAAQEEITRLLPLAQRGDEEATRLLSNARSRRGRAEAAIRREFPDPEPHPAAVLDVRNRDHKEQVASLEERIADAGLAISTDAAELAEGNTLISRLFSSKGLLRPLYQAILNKTGAFETVYSRIQPIVSLARFFGDGKLRVASYTDVAGGGPNLRWAQHDARREAGKVVDILKEIHDALPATGRRERLLQIQSEVISSIRQGRNLEDVDDAPQAARLREAWLDYRDRVSERGKANGSLPEGLSDDFVPLRLEEGRIRSDRTQAFRKMSAVELGFWKGSEELHVPTLERMGWVVPQRDTFGQVTDLEPGTLDRVVRTRSDLTPDEARLYDESLENLRRDPETGETAIGGPGLTAIEDGIDDGLRTLMKETTTGIDSRVLATRLENASRAQSVRGPAFPARITEHPELREYFVRDLGELTFDFAQRTDFRVRAQDALDAHLGMQGVTVPAYLEAMENRLLKIFSGEAQTQQEIKGAFDKLYEVWLEQQGLLPSLLEQADSLTNWGAHFARRAPLALYGGGIGQTILSVEGIISMMMRVHSPADFARNLFAAFRAYGGRAVGDPYVRDQLWGLVMGSRLFSQQHTQRFVAGVMDETTDYSPLSRLVRPWRDAWRTWSGAITPGPGQGGRLGGGTLRTLEAMGTSAMQLGGSRYFTEAAWAVQVASLQRETARALENVAEMRRLLEEVDLQAIARDRGQAEAFRVWRGIARRAGYGSNWQVPLRLQEAGLLETGMAEALLSSGAVRTRGASPMIDLEAADQAVQGLIRAGREQEAELLQEAVSRVSRSIEDTVLKRISEPGSFARTTSTQSRTPIGELTNSMLSFSRSFVYNNTLDTAGMPSALFMMMIGSYIFAESTGLIARRLLDGEELDTIEQEFNVNPALFLSSAALRTPIMGPLTYVPKYLVDAAQGTRYSFNPNASAADSAMRALYNAGSDYLRADPNQQSSRTLSKLAPMSDTLFADAALLAMGRRQDDLRRTREQQRQSRADDYYFSEDDPVDRVSPDEVQEELQRDLSFLFTIGE